MRQPPGNGDFLEIIEIDVIDADPSAFGDATGSRSSARERRPRPRWLRPVALATCTGAAVSLFVLQPWEVPPQWRKFDHPAPSTAIISNLLLPAAPPGPVLAVTEPDSVGSNTPTTAAGYVFAEPGATFGFRRAALFEATPTGTRDAPPATDEQADGPTVHGVPAAFEAFRLRNEIEWGPLDGYSWRVFTTGLSDEESLEFAAAVGAPDGTPALQHDYSLDGMVPLGSVSAFNSATSLRNELSGGHLSSQLSPTMVTYLLDEERDLRVASVPAPGDVMQLVGYVFGAGTSTTVHGLPAQVIDSREVGPMVVWFEGGRLVAVAGAQTDAELLATAESISPAGADEWLNAVSPVLEFYIPVETWPENTAPIEVGSGTTATGVPWRVAITIGNPTVTCVYIGAATMVTSGTVVVIDNDTAATVNVLPANDGQSACTFSTPKVPAAREFPNAFPGVTFVVAIVPIEEFRLVLRVTAADGSITDHEPVTLNEEFTGVAVAIAPDSTYSLVDPSA